MGNDSAVLLIIPICFVDRLTLLTWSGVDAEDAFPTPMNGWGDDQFVAVSGYLRGWGGKSNRCGASVEGSKGGT